MIFLVAAFGLVLAYAVDFTIAVFMFAAWLAISGLTGLRNFVRGFKTGLQLPPFSDDDRRR